MAEGINPPPAPKIASGVALLLLVAGIAPVQAQQLLSRVDGVKHWLPGRRTFAAIMAMAGGWLTISNMMS